MPFLKPFIVVLALLLFSGRLLAAEVRQHFNIPAQSLNNALVQFAADTKLAVIFSADTVRGIAVEALHGQMTAEQALSRLLKDTGYTYRFIDAVTLTLTPSSAPAMDFEEPAPTILDTTLVIDQADDARLDEQSETRLDDPLGYQAINAVTATRTDTPIKQIPQSIQAVKHSLIDDQQNVTLSEVLYNVSGVVPRNTLFTPVIEGTLLRGFRAEQLIDGFTQYYNTGDRESLVNVDRVEVLKGANAIFYSGGSGSPVGGVINVISKLPQARAFREMGFKAGSHAFYQPYIDINQPFNENALFRLTAEYTNSDSWVDVVQTERFNINPTLVLTDNADTKLTLQGKLSRWQQPEYQGLPATGTLAGSFNIRPQTFIGHRDIPNSRSDNDAVWLSLNHRIDEVWGIDIRARYASAEFTEKVQTLFNGASFIADTPLLAPSTWAVVNGELYQRQQEVSLQGYLQAKFNVAGIEHVFLFGGDRGELRDRGYIDVAGRISGLTDLASPSFTHVYQVPGPASNNQFTVNTTYGGYWQLQSHIQRRLHTLLSLRLGGVEIDFDNTLSQVSSKTARLKLLPRLGAAYDVTESISVFAAYSEGMRGQPFVNFASAPTPELSRQMEAGLKWDFSGRLSGQLAVYQIDRNQVAVATPANAAFYTASGRQRSRGFDVDLVWQPLEQINVLASYAHTDARFTDENAGSRLPWVPEDSGRLWAHYRFTQNMLRGFGIGAGVYLSTGAYLSNQNQYKTPGYYNFDAAASYETGPFKLAASIKNLSNEAYFQPFQYFGGGYTGGGRVAPAPGRMFFLSASVKF
ncbi:TonB-dependent siderophore receptor [Methylomonas methanica]|uniref:TonB-dependent siderophore receptor n=1 Tax=Methylomonas methanica TaxID=421 RepID=UPI0002E333E0|nr:TonB-dependent receptor [Methylomonas methanica]